MSAIRLHDDPSARVRLFCLPYAGGGAVLFHSWSAILPRAIQVCPIRLPGREARLKELPSASVQLLAGELAGALETHLEKPFAVFGHSMGAIVAFELVRELRRRYGASPVHLFASASRAPHSRVMDDVLSSLPQDRLLTEVARRYGSFNPKALEFPEILNLLVPALRADLAMLETYRCIDDTPLDCALTAFGGSDDVGVRDDHLQAWSRHTSVSFDSVTLPGGHSFLTSARKELLRAIEDRLRIEAPLTASAGRASDPFMREEQ